MEKTRNIFENVSELLKKYRFNCETQAFEHDEFTEIEPVNHKNKWSSNFSKTFKMRSSAILVSAFLVLVGAGLLDAQTRAYEVLYHGNSIGYVNDPEVLKTAVNTISQEQSSSIDVAASEYELRPARSTDFLTTEEVSQAITETKTQETLQVAKFQSINQSSVTPTPVVTATEVAEVTPGDANSLSETTVKETTRSIASVAETPVVETSVAPVQVVEQPAAVTPVETAAPAAVPEAVAVVAPVAAAPITDVPVAAPVVEAPAVVETPVIEAPIPEVPKVETPVVEAPPVEAPVVAAPVVETPAVEQPAAVDAQVQFILPASGLIGEILRAYDGGYYSNHYGGAAVDILNSEGTSVYAAASGTVTLSGWYGGYGNCVIIDHGNGFSTLYGHFSALDVTEGQTVTQGQRIGSMGSTGSSTANHVHFEVRINDEAQPISNFFSINTGDYI